MSLRISFLLCVAAMVQAQSGPITPVHQPLALGVRNGMSQPDQATQGKIVESYGNLPLTFEANRGQTHAGVKFLLRGAGYTLFLTSDEAVFSLRRASQKADVSIVGRQVRSSSASPTTNAVLRMKLMRANPVAKITGEDELPGRINYFVGNDPKKWRINVPVYAKVKYKEIFAGIDLVYYGNQHQLEYDFVVKPGADPSRIQFDIRGAKHISRNEHGDLILRTPDGEVRWHKPVVYQEKGENLSFRNGDYFTTEMRSEKKKKTKSSRTSTFST